MEYIDTAAFQLRKQMKAGKISFNQAVSRLTRVARRWYTKEEWPVKFSIAQLRGRYI